MSHPKSNKSIISILNKRKTQPFYKKYEEIFPIIGKKIKVKKLKILDNN